MRIIQLESSYTQVRDSSKVLKRTRFNPMPVLVIL